MEKQTTPKLRSQRDDPKPSKEALKGDEVNQQASKKMARNASGKETPSEDDDVLNPFRSFFLPDVTVRPGLEITRV